MKRFFVLFFVFLAFAFDVIFFDYDLSDIMNIKEDVNEITKQLDKSLELIFPFYFESLGFAVKNCDQLRNYEPVAMNLFEENGLIEMKEKCQLKEIIKRAKVSKIDFVKDIKLGNVKYWDKALFLDYGCEITNSNKKYENYKNGKDLEKNNIIKVIYGGDKGIIFVNNELNRMFFVKEILRANFNDDKTRDILLKISVSDEDNKYIKCVNYAVFTRESADGLMVEKKLDD